MNLSNAYQNYLETTVSTSDAVELTRLLYRAGIDALRRACEAVAVGNISERGKQVVRTQQIVAELASALQPERSPELTLQLARIYEYVLFLVQKGNFEQQQAPLAEAQQLLEVLLTGWEQGPTTAQKGASAA